MKKAGIIATVAAGIVLVGGGAWAATTLPVTDEGTVASATIAPSPAASADPVAEVTPTPTVTPTPEVENEATQFAAYIRPFLAPLDFQPTDEEVSEALSVTCGADAAGESKATDPITPFVDVDAQANQIFVDAAIRDYC